MIQEQDERKLNEETQIEINNEENRAENTAENASDSNNLEDHVIDPIKQLTNNQNPIPLMAVLDRIDLQSKNEDGVPIFNLLCNKFLPLSNLLQDRNFALSTDRDGRTPLHYAVEADDIKAAYECLRRGAKNVKDNFGNTPVMDAVKFGHRRSFLLCIHFQHLNDNLPHIAAKYNRVWELKALQSFGFDLWNRDEHSMTPQQTAIENYAYQAAEYLTTISPYTKLPNLRALTDSEAMIRRVIRVSKQSTKLNMVTLPLLQKIAFWLITLIAIKVFPCFDTARQARIKQMLFVVALYLMIWFLSLVGQKNKRDQFKNILHILRQPYFPTMGEVCPSCIEFTQPELDHCDQCKECVPKFHQHKLFCINKKNQIAWYIYEFYWFWLLTSLFTQIFLWRKMTVLVTTPPSYKIYQFFLTLDLSIQKGETVFFFFLIFLAFIWMQQCLFCLQLFGMAFMNRTYQEVTHSQDYPHLYEPFKTKDGKIRLKEFRLFMRWKLLGGLCMGIRNILLYFL